ncbi:MAG TPA: hypothetical protein PKA28_16255 [Methylomusa anaerophila]|uniref:Bacteriophage N4 adsorption protein B n=1 Tax=Methylomusa anaerophila TaxID=1930071 RepID=A0A348AMR4_9FIRM|nr:hypothetical protein [Methylomusa anaerophila]BBB92362.1 bacteriophage N4 adsorption protein B [Methylomusa anaerophila]HML89999.1 hypothetical protein [Methylomusa anaerophila]
MFSQYFGQYLFNKEILTVDQLYDAFEYERSVRVKLGVLAINSGLMTANQVEEVHQLQQVMDRKFGEIAIAKGYLTSQQVDQLLDAQNNRHLSLSQAIVDKGFLSLSQLENTLESYKQANQFTSNQFKSLQNRDIDAIVRIFLDFSEEKTVADLYYDYTALFLRNIIRFLDDEPILTRSIPFSQDLPQMVGNWFVTQSISGNVNLFTGLLLEDLSLLELARRFSQEDLAVIDELTKDSAAEFLNVHNGVFSVNMSDRGTELDLTPQSISDTIEIPVKNGHRIPINLSFGQIQLIIASAPS